MSGLLDVGEVVKKLRRLCFKTRGQLGKTDDMKFAEDMLAAIKFLCYENNSSHTFEYNNITEEEARSRIQNNIRPLVEKHAGDGTGVSKYSGEVQTCFHELRNLVCQPERSGQSVSGVHGSAACMEMRALLDEMGRLSAGARRMV